MTNKVITCFFCFEQFEVSLEISTSFTGSNIEIYDCVICCNPNKIDYGVHLRPSFFVSGEGSIQSSSPVSLGIVVVPAGGVIDKGSWDSRPFRLGISSWKRIDDNSMPPRIKCAANYQNARMALIQAETDGYDGALMLDTRGHVAEEARACRFLV